MEVSEGLIPYTWGQWLYSPSPQALALLSSHFLILRLIEDGTIMPLGRGYDGAELWLAHCDIFQNRGSPYDCFYWSESANLCYSSALSYSSYPQELNYLWMCRRPGGEDCTRRRLHHTHNIRPVRLNKPFRLWVELLTSGQWQGRQYLEGKGMVCEGPSFFKRGLVIDRILVHFYLILFK